MTYKLPQREIKFRAWDKKEKFMFKNITLNFISLMSDNGSIFMTKKEWGKKWFPNEREWKERLVWMQYTGLHDKNGKEIYEGDIVKGFWQDREIKDKVIWWERGSGWYVGYDDGERHNVTALRALENLEVIGDIFQNPELLTQTYE